MQRLSGSLCVLLLLSCCGTFVRAAEPASPTGPRRLALLIGASRYRLLQRPAPLEGPANDVELFGGLLRERFRFDQVTMLHDRLEDPGLLPTRDNVVREFGKLVETARPGDHVVILLSGHGSQQPADEDPDDPEADGLDEIFLPTDARGWLDTIGGVQNVIVDDEIAGWLAAIADKGAFVCLLADCCHSGTLMRGAPETQRHVPPQALCPPEALERARSRAETARRGGAAEGVFGPSLDSQRVVAIYAAMPHETTPELRLPKGSDDRKPQGLFTFYLVATLEQALEEGGGGITYRELLQLLRAKYAEIRRRQPTPLIEGGGTEREVFGFRELPGRPAHRITGVDDDGNPLVDMGALHGLTPRSVLAVYRPAGQAGAEQPFGYVEATEVRTVTSAVRPVRHEHVDAPALESLRTGCRCRLEFLDFGDMQQAVAVQAEGEGDYPFVTHKVGEGPPDAELVLAELSSGDGSLVRRVREAEDADWFVRLIGDRYVLVPASGFSSPDVQAGAPAKEREIVPTQFDLGPAGRPGALAETIGSALARIAAAENLLRVAGDAAQGRKSEMEAQVELELRVRRAGAREFAPAEPGPGGMVLRDGDKVYFRLKNPGRVAVDVTLLYVDSAYGIESFFPRGPGTDNTIPGGGELSVGSPARAIPMKAPYGKEHFIALAVEAEGKFVNFMSLQQDPIDEAGGVRGGAPKGGAQETPLGKLLQRAIAGQGGVKGATMTDFATYDASVVSCMTLPAAPAEAGPAEPDVTASARMPAGENFTILSPRATTGLLRPARWEPEGEAEERPKGVAEAELYARVAPAVVVIRTRDGAGSGFIIDEDGHVLTNAHVVADGCWLEAGRREARVHLGRLDPQGFMRLEGDAVPAIVLKSDARRDLALLRMREVPDQFVPLPQIPIAEAPVRPGEDCAIIGHPTAGMLWSFRLGHVSGAGNWPGDFTDQLLQALHARGRPVTETEAPSGESRRVLMTSFGTNPGDSGAPVLNEEGELIGVHFASFRDEPHLEEFSYNIHLDEVQEFLARKPAGPAVSVPDPWDRVTPYGALADVDGDGRPDALAFGMPDAGGELALQLLLFDVDNDTPVRYLRNMERLVEERAWDFEVALSLGSAPPTAAYDTDGDDRLDLVFVLSEDGERSEARYQRGPDGDWKYSEEPSRAPLSGRHLENGKLARRFDAMIREVLQ